MVCPSDFLSIFNIGQPFLSGAVVGYQYEIMGRLGKRSAKTAPMPVETPVVRTKLQKSLVVLFFNSSSVAGFQNPHSCSIRVCMASAIRKQLKQNGQHRFLELRFRQNDEDSASSLTR